MLHEVFSAGGKIIGIFRNLDKAHIFADIERKARTEQVNARIETGELITDGEVRGELTYATVGIQVRTRTITFDDHLIP